MHRLSKVTWKAGTMLYPLPPVMVSCGTMEKSNIITVAWTGTVNSEPPMTYVSVRPERYSYGLIKETGEFVINLTTDRLVWNADFCGVKSGRDVDKFALPGLTAIAASEVSAPMIEESPVNIECRVERSMLLGSHEMFLAKIIAVNVSEKLLDAKGVLHLEKAGLAATAHGKYFTLGRQVGSFGYSVKKR
ncbi:flavin reductase family protein [Cloacibacillus evryensis]|uniref:flavin reductase family protein n=1 Tax=Cloacibacillus evryensis TaxID=508460 RepID=UPI0022E6CC5F|nr:flavin reductase family protein [Cloacibacillus evryensis]